LLAVMRMVLPLDGNDFRNYSRIERECAVGMVKMRLIGSRTRAAS
jgi:hypothetical protein